MIMRKKHQIVYAKVSYLCSEILNDKSAFSQATVVFEKWDKYQYFNLKFPKISERSLQLDLKSDIDIY